MVDYALHTCGGFDVSGNDMTYERITANRNYGFGIRFDVHGTRIVMRDCEMKDNKSDGGLFHEIEWGPIDLINCRIENNVGTGFLMLNAQNVTIDSSTLRNNTESQLTFYNNPSRTTQVSVTDDTEEPITIVANFTIRNSIMTTTGDSSFLIERKYRVGSHESYEEMYRNEFTGENNRYYNPDNENVFEISTRYFVREFANLEGWKAATGSEGGSVWGLPVNTATLAPAHVAAYHKRYETITMFDILGRTLSTAAARSNVRLVSPKKAGAAGFYILRRKREVNRFLRFSTDSQD
jgi:hypothetical protein